MGSFAARMLLVTACTMASLVCQTPPGESAASATAASAGAPEPAAAYDPASINLGIGAILPSDRPYVPLTGKERYTIWYRDNFLNPQKYAKGTFWSLMDVSRNRPPEWGSGVSGFGKRFGSRFARSFIASSIEDASAAGLGYDVRYISSDSKSTKARLGHAVLYRFITLNRDGKRVFNLPPLLGTFAAEMLATKWTPGEKWSAHGVRSANEQVVFGIGMNVLKEFLPDIRRKLKRK